MNSPTTDISSAAASSTLPPLTDLQQLLHAISIECRPNEAVANSSSVDTTAAAASSSSVPLIRNVSHKLELQQRLKEHARQWQQKKKENGSDEDGVYEDGTAAFDSASLPPPTSSPLIRQLSLAAQRGLISHNFKVEMKNMLLNESSVHQSGTTLAPTRLVRGVTESGESIVTEEKIDLSHIDPAVCAQLQEEERDALTAIYEESVSFDTVTRSIDREGRITESKANMDGSLNEESEVEDEMKQDQLNDAVELIGGSVETQLCQSVTVTIKPYPASGPERNLVSTRVRFILPPLYPYLRPSFKLLTCEGEMNSADGMMCSTAIQDAMNEIYEKEPMDESEVRVMLFDLINAAQEFLIEYIAFLEDKEYHAKLEAEEAERQRLLEADRLRKEAEMKHAAAVLAYQTSDHTKLEWAHANQPSPAQLAEWEAKRAEEERIQKKLQTLLTGKGEVFASLLPSPDQLMEHIRVTSPYFPQLYHDQYHAKEGVFLKMVASPFLIYRFLQRRKKYENANRPTKVDIGFHGTSGYNVRSIEENGLAVPGETVGGKTVYHKTDEGYYGKGIYLSHCASTSLQYSCKLDNLFACLVLRGRVRSVKLEIGQDLAKGADSHVADTGDEWIIFDSHCVLPIYRFCTQRPYQKVSYLPSKAAAKAVGKAKAHAAAAASSASSHVPTMKDSSKEDDEG